MNKADLINEYTTNSTEYLECPDCDCNMKQIDTTYSNINTHRVMANQHTGNIYFCENCENYWLENLLNNSNLERWAW